MLEFQFDPFPELSSSRLSLRRMTFDDADQVYRFQSDEQIMQYNLHERATSLEAAKEMIFRADETIDSNEGVIWGIYFHRSPHLIGNIGFWRTNRMDSRAEIGYFLDPKYWKKGLMIEAMQQVIAYGFSVMKLRTIDAEVHPLNFSSISLLEKMKFQLEEKKPVFFEINLSVNSILYCLHSDDYFMKCAD